MENKEFEREVLERLTKIETKIDDYTSIKAKVEEAYNKSRNNEKDINEINERLKWITRLITGTIITGIIGIVFTLLQK